MCTRFRKVAETLEAGITAIYKNPLIQGFTTNPTLMRKANVTDYKNFALDVLRIVPDRPTLTKERGYVLRPTPKPLNVFQADNIGCHIIIVTNDVLAKLSLVGKDLLKYSLETVEMFRGDAVKAGFMI